MYQEYKEGTYVIEHEDADIWVAKNLKQDQVNYYYGGTRTVPHNYSKDQAYEVISYLRNYESGLKNLLINEAIQNGVFEKDKERLPIGFSNSIVGGGRCIIQPKTKEIESIILDTMHPRHKEVIDSLFKTLGDFLENQDGVIKLTPDFGKFAGLADMLYQYTDNVLGIRCEDGGCGGKASYTSTGIIAAIEAMGYGKDYAGPVTLIGSNGACGIGVLAYLMEKGYKDIAVADLFYDDNPELTKELGGKGVKILPGIKGKFTDECLCRGGLIVATTTGGELLNSNLSVIKDGTVLLLAHNEAIPVTQEALDTVEEILNKKNICIIPGQLLTFGGALTSRLEWFFRANRKEKELFNKEQAHDSVRKVTNFCFKVHVEGKERTNLFRRLFSMVD
ncbi:hypothetical protein [Anaerocolumna xylanovorans]|uniref:Uncharacterized protein n=1 Tax=Anaerocolumna xylanovorans DSM 12503 TaxID=1121345 RepID=A0A1M7YI73_9FIRM|nr:hypothetical protein [Anaerocolumna xylanovorans]SHO52311.1 hypothetical protein SAMN02745217_03577 [Anaerocolumna xylanovorans DSM 12503]